jgi:rhomboid protease GluP
MSAINDQPVQDEPVVKSKVNVKETLAMFIPSKGYWITPVLLYINVAVFVVMLLSGVGAFEPTGQELIRWGANYRPLTLDGQPWRLFTCTFVHIGLLHLLLNCYALVYIGHMLEPLMGSVRFAVAYLLAGICGSLLSLYWHDYSISAGASGAVFGLFGVLAAFLTTDLIVKEARAELLKNIAIVVGINLVYGLKGGIDNAGHIGGLLGGALVGYVLYPSMRQWHNTKLRNQSLGIVAGIVLAGTVLLVAVLPNPMGIYFKTIKAFSENEETALNYYELPDTASKALKMQHLYEYGIDVWKQNLALLDSLEKEPALPPAVYKEIAFLRHYTQLRVNVYILTARALRESSGRYDADIQKINQQINTLTQNKGLLPADADYVVEPLEE